MKKIKLFCLPYAGGSSIIYKKWQPLLPDDIELVAVELAGRGKRSNEPLYKDVAEAVEDVYSIITRDIYNAGDYAIYGHSMGAMLAYELAQKIRANNLPEPLHVFFSGRGTPHIKSKREKIYHTMDDKEFQKEILNLGGTPKEFFEYPELMDYLLPILKSDFKISETAVREKNIHPLNYDITVCTGKQEEELEAEDIHGWMLHTKQLCTVHYFNGGHFFINDEAEKIVDLISKTLHAHISRKKAGKML
jgi:medium-chain acyl-[acyl-carrier-protein] hydrolase